MDPLRNFFREWFGYSRRDRRSTFILLIIIIVVTGVRYMVPNSDTSFSEILFTDTLEYEDSSFPDTRTVIYSTQKEKTGNSGKRQLIDINACDSAALEALPGIGPVLSSRIIRYRNLIGGFVTVGQLREVYGLSEDTFNLISERLIADTLAVRKIRINSADYRMLIRHPYFSKGEVDAIFKFRELAGNINDISVMINNNLISAETARKIRGYLDFAE
jgi:DNA uptake protein ComE-like DNA-binding protein